MSGLLMRHSTAGPDDIRQPWSLSSRRARGSWRFGGVSSAFGCDGWDHHVL